MIQQLEHVKLIPSMDVMEIQTILQHNKIVKIIAVLKVVQMGGKFGRNQMVQLVHAHPIDNAQAHIIVPLSQLGLVPYIKQNPFVVHLKIMYAHNLVMLEFGAAVPELLDIISMLIQKLVPLLNTMVVKEIEIILQHKKHVKIIAFLKHVHLEPLLQKNLIPQDLYNAQILVELDEFRAAVPMDIHVIQVHCWIKMFVVVHPQNCKPFALQLLLPSSLPFHFNQCNVLQMLMGHALEISSVGSLPPPQLLMHSIVVDHLIQLIQDIVLLNLSLYLGMVVHNIVTAPPLLQSMMPFKDVVQIGIANIQQILKDIFVVDLKVMFGCQMFAPHNLQIWFQLN
jgi:hypothetical protein